MQAPPPQQSIHDAAREGDLLSVATLCSSDPKAVDKADKLHRTPLILAAWAGRTEVVQLLLGAGANANARAVDNVTALHFAAQNGHAELARVLLAAGAKVDAPNRKSKKTPLHLSAERGHRAAAEVLLAAGACASLKSSQGKTPDELVPAAAAGAEELAQLLRQAASAAAVPIAAAAARVAAIPSAEPAMPASVSPIGPAAAGPAAMAEDGAAQGEEEELSGNAKYVALGTGGGMPRGPLIAQMRKDGRSDADIDAVKAALHEAEKLNPPKKKRRKKARKQKTQGPTMSFGKDDE